MNTQHDTRDPSYASVIDGDLAQDEPGTYLLFPRCKPITDLIWFDNLFGASDEDTGVLCTNTFYFTPTISEQKREYKTMTPQINQHHDVFLF